MIRKFWWAVLAWFVCTEREARAIGMTHTCTFLGVAHWMRWVEDDEGDTVPHLIPKATCLTLWLAIWLRISNDFLLHDVEPLPVLGAEEIAACS